MPGVGLIHSLLGASSICVKVMAECLYGGKMRKVIQISITPDVLGNEEITHEGVYALCDDGTIWRTWNANTRRGRWNMWEKIPEIPQDETQ